MAASATLALKAGAWVRRVRLVMFAPDPRQLRRSQAETPLIDLSGISQPSLGNINRVHFGNRSLAPSGPRRSFVEAVGHYPNHGFQSGRGINNIETHGSLKGCGKRGLMARLRLDFLWPA